MLYIIDLQTAVAAEVSQIFKVVRTWSKFIKRKKSPSARCIQLFKPADRSNKVTYRVVIFAADQYWCSFQSTLVFRRHTPVSAPDTFGQKCRKWRKMYFPELALQFHFSHHISCLLDLKKNLLTWRYYQNDQAPAFHYLKFYLQQSWHRSTYTNCPKK